VANAVDWNQVMLGVVRDLKQLQTIEYINWAVKGNVTTDPAQLVAPGILVRLASIERITMGRWNVNMQLILVAGDTDSGPGPQVALSDMFYSLCDSYAQPDGPCTPITVQLPQSPAPMPGLVFPLTVRKADE
jgi:hypothetical protein